MLLFEMEQIVKSSTFFSNLTEGLILCFFFLQEGIDYLESEGKTKLLEMQGLKDPEPAQNSLKRDGTMAVTAKVNCNEIS